MKCFRGVRRRFTSPSTRFFFAKFSYRRQMINVKTLLEIFEYLKKKFFFEAKFCKKFWLIFKNFCGVSLKFDVAQLSKNFALLFEIFYCYRKVSGFPPPLKMIDVAAGSKLLSTPTLLIFNRPTSLMVIFPIATYTNPNF